jgi:xanthine dehydrogenase small subunit
MRSSISFVLDSKIVNLDFSSQSQIRPTTTVLNYLRSLPNHKGTKRGCDEGDCGACTVALGELGTGNKIHYNAVDSCLMFLPMLHGKHLVTVENLKDADGNLHSVQKALVDNHGSQCGFCTPGIIMSMFGLYKNERDASREEIDSALTGNLCRCTGYQTIVEAVESLKSGDGSDHFTNEETSIVELLRSIPRESVSLDTSRQRYSLPATVAEAVNLLRNNVNAVILSGATDIALRVTKRYELITDIIDLSQIDSLKAVKNSSECLEIGASVVLQDVLPLVKYPFPALYSMLKVFGSKQIRNLATLGGNLGTASPISDTLPVLMAYNAKVVVEGVHGKREIPIDEFIVGYRKTVRKQNEIITSVILPQCGDHAVIRSYKVAKRREFDISTVSGGFRLEQGSNNTVKSITLAYGGMADHTMRSRSAEQYLVGKQWTRENVEQAMQLLDNDFHPISDVRASAEMRQIVAKNLLLKFWAETHSNGSN